MGLHRHRVLTTPNKSYWRNTISAIVSQQTIVTTTFSNYQSIVMFGNIRNHKIMIFVKHIFALDIYLRLRSLLRFFVKRGPGHICHSLCLSVNYLSLSPSLPLSLSFSLSIYIQLIFLNQKIFQYILISFISPQTPPPSTNSQ